MKHLASDAKNIKESLSRMQKYILGKLIESNKANEVKDFKGIGKAMWEFISTIYESYWDNLFADNNKTTFRTKIKSKFNPQVTKPQALPKEKEIVKPIFVLSLSPPIPAKSQKEVNKLLTYFKKNVNTSQKKLYAQALSSSKQTNFASMSSITINMLKLKETFPNLPNVITVEPQSIFRG